MYLRQQFERSLENKISRQRKSSEFETIRTRIQLFDAIRFVAGTTDFPVICHVSDARDITRNRRETILRYKQFGKSIVKYNAFKQNFTLFCSTSEPKGVSFTLWIFRWRIFDRRDVLYALGNDKVENEQPPEAANVLNWFEKFPYLLCWKLGRSLNSTKKYETDETWMNYQPSLLPIDLCQVRAKRQKGKKKFIPKGKKYYFSVLFFLFFFKFLFCLCPIVNLHPQGPETGEYKRR